MSASKMQTFKINFQPIMNNKILKLAYANLMAESAAEFTRHGILQKITEEKYPRQIAKGRESAAMMGITNPKEAFETISSTFGCANWEVEETAFQFKAQTTSCMLCALAKKYNSDSPCKLYCLNPLEGLIKAVNLDYEFKVKSTLFESDRCEVSVSKATELQKEPIF